MCRGLLAAHMAILMRESRGVVSAYHSAPHGLDRTAEAVLVGITLGLIVRIHPYNRSRIICGCLSWNRYIVQEGPLGWPPLWHFNLTRFRGAAGEVPMPHESARPTPTPTPHFT